MEGGLDGMFNRQSNYAKEILICAANVEATYSIS